MSSIHLRRKVALAVAVAVLATAAPAHAECDLATYQAMKQSSEAALNNRMNNLDGMFNGVRSFKPSQMACLDRFMNLSFSSLMSNFSIGGLISGLVGGIVNGLVNMISNQVCSVVNNAWNATMNPIQGMNTGVTLPGGAGSVRVGVTMTSDGRLIAGAGLPGGSIQAPNNGSTPLFGGAAPAQAPAPGLLDQGATWMKSGLTRVQSWFK